MTEVNYTPAVLAAAASLAPGPNLLDLVLVVVNEISGELPGVKPEPTEDADLHCFKNI